MFARRFFQCYFLMAMLMATVCFQAFAQEDDGIPIRFDLDNSGISSSLFTNPRRPYPLDCLLVGDCGKEEKDKDFPGIAYLAGKKGEKLIPSQFKNFHLRFSNLSSTKTFLLSIPMDIKVSELLKFVYRVGHLEINERKLQEFLRKKRNFDEAYQLFPSKWEEEPNSRLENLGELLDYACSLEHVEIALELVPKKGILYDWDANGAPLKIEEILEEVQALKRNDKLIKLLFERMGKIDRELISDYEEKQETIQIILKNLMVLRCFQELLLEKYEKKDRVTYVSVKSEFQILEEFNSEKYESSGFDSSRFIDAFFKGCPPKGVKSGGKILHKVTKKCSHDGYFCQLVATPLNQFGIIIPENQPLVFEGLNEIQKSFLLEFFGEEILLLPSKADEGLLRFFTYYYLSGEDKSIGSGSKKQKDSADLVNPDGATEQSKVDILENILKKACKTKKKVFSGNFVYLMAPKDSFQVSRSQMRFLHAVSMPKEEMLIIKVAVFNESDTITYSSGYLAWRGGRTLKSRKSWALGGSISYKQQPDLEGSPQFSPLEFKFLNDEVKESTESERILVGELKPYVSDQSEFLSGTGKLTLAGNVGTIANAQVILDYQARNFGTEDKKDKVSASMYRIKAFQGSGGSIAFGKFGFDTPADGLGISLIGEGLHYQRNFFNLGYLIRQESDGGKPNAANRDHKVYWGKVPNLGLPRWGFFHTLSFHAIYGQNEQDTYKVKLTDEDDLQGQLYIYKPDDNPDEERPTPVPIYYQVEENEQPYSYWTLGLKGRFSYTHSKKWSSSGSLAYFQSERRARLSSAKASVMLPEMMTKDSGDSKRVSLPRESFIGGEGRSWLLSWTLQENQDNASVSQGNNVQHRFQFLLGHGSGGYRQIQKLDRGYLGETSSFAPDMIFLSSLTSALAKIEPTIGTGLSNKTYASLTYQRDGAPLVKNLMKMAGWDESLVKANTTFSLHFYRLNSIDELRNRHILDTKVEDEPYAPFSLDSKKLGWEFNLVAEASLPNKIKPRFMAAYFAPGSALDDLVKKDLWFVGLSLSIDF